MTKEQEEFIRRNKKLDELCEETQGYSRMQFIDRIATSEIDKENLIKYLERESKEVHRDCGVRQNIFRDILERVKSGKYE